MTNNSIQNQAHNPNYHLIPDGTILKLRIIILRGGYNNPHRLWTGGYATRNDLTGEIYLNVRFKVTEGPYRYRSVFGRIYLYSPQLDEKCNISRVFVRRVLSSARNVPLISKSQEQRDLVTLRFLQELDGIEFLGRACIKQNSKGIDKNYIYVVTPNNKDYVQN